MVKHDIAWLCQKGLSLVEFVIILVIIGLLLGSVFKREDLSAQVTIRKISNDLNGIAVAAHAYQDRYRRLPGDDPGAASRWTLLNGTTVTGDNTISGSYFAAPTDTGPESTLFWAHLRLAGFIAGDTSTIQHASIQPLNAAGGIMGVQNGGLGLVGTIVCVDRLPAKIAQALDSQMDDGNARTGQVRASLQGASRAPLPANAPTADYVDDGGNFYVLCKNI